MMNMKKIFMFLMVAAMLLPISCTKEKEKMESPSLSGAYEYSGKMTVTAGGVENVSDNVLVEARIDEKAQTLDILFYKVKFVPQMPISLDVTVSGVKFSVSDGSMKFSGDGIVPLSGGTVPFPKYTVTSLTGTLSDSGLYLSLNFGDYPVSYTGILSN